MCAFSCLRGNRSFKHCWSCSCWLRIHLQVLNCTKTADSHLVGLAVEESVDLGHLCQIGWLLAWPAGGARPQVLSGGLLKMFSEAEH
jgi:hypothetical protein